MSTNIQIFSSSDSGVVRQRLRTVSDTVYFTLAGTSGADLKAVLMGSAPATNLQVTEAVDYDMHKALNGGFLVASFGYAPVQIVLNGVDIWSSPKECQRFTTDIKGWWDRYNLHASPDSRIRMNLHSAQGSVNYECITTNIVRSVVAGTKGVGSYQLNIIGVRMQ